MATLYQYHNTNDTDYLGVSGIYWRGMSFTPVTSHLATSVKLKLWRVGTPGTVTVSVHATDASGWATGSALATGTTDGDTLDLGTVAAPIAGDWREVTFTTGVLARADVKYAYVVRAPSADGSTDILMWRQDPGQNYARGKAMTSSDSGVTWADYAADLMFEDWGEAQGTGGGGSILPSDAITRVTGLIHRYDNRRGIYQLEISLGDVSSTLTLPYGAAPKRITDEKQKAEDKKVTPAPPPPAPPPAPVIVTPLPLLPPKPPPAPPPAPPPWKEVPPEYALTFITCAVCGERIPLADMPKHLEQHFGKRKKALTEGPVVPDPVTGKCPAGYHVAYDKWDTERKYPFCLKD